jgi:large subunit ribosomal protein L35
MTRLRTFYEIITFDDSIKSLNFRFSIIPMKMGIQVFQFIYRFWIPAGAGMTNFYELINFRGDEKAMPKLKSNRGASKRLRATGTGKIKHYKAFGSHLLTHKTTKRKRNLRGSEVLNKQDTKNMKRLLPYL